jgi:hypothetical protein
MKQHFSVFLLSVVTATTVVAQERIELRADGNYDVYYMAHQGNDEDQPLYLRKDIYYVRTKIKPSVTSSFTTNSSGQTVYRYTLSNGVGALQGLTSFTTDRITSIVATRPLDGKQIGNETQQQADSADLRAGIAAVTVPTSWHGSALQLLTRPDLGLRAAFGARENGALAAGSFLSGLGFTSKDLPGITRATRLAGLQDGLTSFYAPKPQGTVGDQLEDIRSRDFISLLVAIPRVQVDAPLNTAVTLGSWSTEMTRSIWPEVITATLANQVKADIDAAKNAVERNNKTGATQNLQALIARVPNDTTKSKDDQLARSVLRFNANYLIARLK